MGLGWRWLGAGAVLIGLAAGRSALAADLDHYRQGLYLLQQRQYDQAREQFRIALLDRPADPDALCGLGVALYQLNALQEASQAFDRALAATAEARVQAQARSGLGDIYLQLGEFAAAVDQYRKALSHSPHWIGVRLNLARALIAQGQAAAADLELVRILHERPDLAEAHQLHGELALRRNEPGLAFRHLSQAWSSGRHLGEGSFRQWLDLAVRLGDYASVVPVISRYPGPRTAGYWAATGEVWRHWALTLGSRQALGLDIPLHQRSDIGRLTAHARAALQRSLLLDPDQPAVRLSLAELERLDGRDGTAYLLQQGRHTLLPKPHARAAAGFALAAGKRHLALALSELVANSGDGDDVARHARLLSLTGTGGSFDANSVEGRYWLGHAAWQQGDRAMAESHWQDLPSGVWQCLAEAQRAWRDGDDTAAWHHLEQAASARHDESLVYRLAGEWALARGEVGRALHAWEWGSRVGLPDPELLTHLAELHEHLGHPGAARAAWRQALRVAPRQGRSFDRFWHRLLEAPLPPPGISKQRTPAIDHRGRA